MDDELGLIEYIAYCILLVGLTLQMLCRDLRSVVLAVQMTLSDLPPYVKGTLSIDIYLHEITQFILDTMLTSHVRTFDQQVTRKMTLYFSKNRKLKIFPVQIQWESASTFPFPVPRMG